ncbi:hypothetical protein [Methylobacterium pseudosasicola]|uniref:Uncharacterized protein n=1 Tax=Methylobacterium pseudosasicola TaxID=582667 RepID=A0A1I4NLX7_9HYPH|nr:hypothetical protein [Methylobacterium pseudosasicola]SFM16163.1 hypothetical protein SAMN05192568_102146 [Methylobacterium pseudosasicola]
MIERFLLRVVISAGGAPAVALAAHAHLSTPGDVAVCVCAGFVGLFLGLTAAACEPGGR